MCSRWGGGGFLAPPWFQPSIWQGNTTNSSSSDLYDTCSSSYSVGIPLNFIGYQPARTGHGYAGIFFNEDTFNYREYIEVSLLDTLKANKKYCVQFYVSLSDSSTEAISNIGAYFSVDSLLNNSVLQHPTIDYVTPQIENPVSNIISDTTNWVLISGNFIAHGGEKFMTIGNFHLPANTNIINVAPVSSGGINSNAYYYIDDVSVIYCDPSGVEEVTDNSGELIIYPNPASSQLIIDNGKLIIKEIKIYNVLGEFIHQQVATNNQQQTIDIESFAKGVYFVEVQTGKGTLRKKFVKE